MLFVRAEIAPIVNAERREYQADAAGDNARAIIEELRRQSVEYTEIAAQRTHAAAAREAARHRRRWTASVVAGPNINVGHLLADEDLLDTLALSVEKNVALIRNISSEVVGRVEREALRSILEGRSVNDFRKSISDIEAFGRRRARLIARDQTTKINAAMTQFRHEQAGVTHYKWRTTMDGRERPTHHDNNGKIFAWDKPSKITGHPGHDIQCRCNSMAVILDDPEDTAGLIEPPPTPTDVGAQLPLFKAVGSTLAQRVTSWPRNKIVARQAEAVALKSSIRELKAASDVVEADAAKMAETMFGHEIADDMLDAQKRRRTALFAVMLERLGLIDDMLDHAKRFSQNGDA